MITRDTNRAAANVRKWFNDDYKEWDAYSIDGKTISKSGYNGPVVWIREEPTTPYRIGVLGHEVFHAVCRIMERAGVNLTYNSEDAFAYLYEHILDRVLSEKRKPATARKKSAKKKPNPKTKRREK